MDKNKLKEVLKTIVTEESEYKVFFQKALEKAGKSIPSMSDEEKKAFFNKIDAAWDGRGEKNEELTGNQHKLDVDGDGEIEASDLAALRAKKDESVNEEKYTVIDPKGNPAGTAEKMQVVMAAKKKGGENAGYFVVSAKNALKAKRALEKFKGDFKNPKLKDMMADLYENKLVNEADDLDIGHQDDEPNMLKSTALELAQYAAKLVQKLDQYDKMPQEVDFPNWWQAKLILAKDYVHGAYHYLDSKETLGEGRAFVSAAKKAKQEGKTEFEFNGKTYPVTIKD